MLLLSLLRRLGCSLRSGCCCFTLVAVFVRCACFLVDDDDDVDDGADDAGDAVDDHTDDTNDADDDDGDDDGDDDDKYDPDDDDADDYDEYYNYDMVTMMKVMVVMVVALLMVTATVMVSTAWRNARRVSIRPPSGRPCLALRGPELRPTDGR